MIKDKVFFDINSDDINLRKQNNFKERHKDDFYMKNKLFKAWDTLKPAIIVGIIVFCVFKLIILNGFIPSESMEPTLLTNNFVIANRLAYKSTPPKRGDVIVIDSTEYQELLVKRVIGLPGDKIELKENKVYVNGCLLDESEYAVGETKVLVPGHDSFEVPKDSIFVMGDNREHSSDARYWKNSYISYDDVVGKVVLEYSIGGDDGFYAKRIHSIQPKFIGEENKE